MSLASRVQTMKNVAVVAVHGVGTHSPHATAEAVEQLLLRIQASDGTARYTSFHEEALDIPCTPLTPSSQLPDTRHSLFEERLPRLRGSQTPPGADAADRRLMDALLDDYTPTSADSVYESVRFTGQRLEGGTPRTNVHVYEMFWSDISAIGNTFWSVFGDLYQLIIHLPIIGLQTIDFATQSEAKAPRRWKWLRGLYRAGLLAFTAFLPTLNLLMLALCLPILVLQQLSPRTQLWLVAGAAAIAGTAVLISRQLRSTKSTDWRRALSVSPVAIVGAAALFQHRIAGITVQRCAILTCWIAMAVVLRVVLQAFDKSRPGVYRIGTICFVALSLILIFYSLGGGGTPTQLEALLYTFEWAYVAQFMSWLVFVVFASGFVLMSWFTVTGAKLRAAASTARLTVAIPAFVFVVVTTLFWGAIYYGPGHRLLPSEELYQSRFCYPALELSNPVVSTVRPTRCPVVVSPAALGPAFEGGGASRLALYAAGVLALAVLVLFLAVGPSILAELRPADDTGTDRSQALGAWLTFGLRAGRVSSLFAACALLLACAATLLVVPYWPAFRYADWFISLRTSIHAVPTALQSLRFGGALIASGSAIGIVALSKRFTRVGIGLKPALASALDVEVYFRELPHRRTPRARMVSRYASLLGHLCRWRDSTPPSGQGYDAIVIVAHSQGTVITVDLLRYLQCASRADPALDCLRSEAHPAGIPVILLTLGCPLHQLYARRFPHLYCWVARGDLGAESTTPDRAELRGVSQWVNLYRSGDYIGRALWRGEGPDAYDTAPTRPAHTEACLGPGAHTHYLDPTSSAVAKQLDRLIDTA
jgi:hypothetical protein